MINASSSPYHTSLNRNHAFLSSLPVLVCAYNIIIQVNVSVRNGVDTSLLSEQVAGLRIAMAVLPEAEWIVQVRPLIVEFAVCIARGLRGTCHIMGYSPDEITG